LDKPLALIAVNDGLLATKDEIGDWTKYLDKDNYKDPDYFVAFYSVFLASQDIYQGDNH